ncbi:MAG: NAD(P)H:quinone oxidoreductase [Candidatus Omnitrophica bacterium]|jgi:NAD(P)H dehydrogenase (quinone)|nr:NAD(P)H:quinone oxidoreductase [Candidatus Omnitrophota bacterium]
MAKTKVLVLYYSMYGNIFTMANEIVKGIKQVNDAEPVLKQVPDLLPEEIIQNNLAIKQAKDMQKDVPIAKVSDLRDCDGLIIGTPTRYGNMCAQVKNFLDQTGKIWEEGVLIGKPAGIFTSTATLHGGQETTIISTMIPLFHHGMIIVGVPYSVKELFTTKTGGTPYGPSHVSGLGLNPLSEEEIYISKFLGKRVAEIAIKLK